MASHGRVSKPSRVWARIRRRRKRLGFNGGADAFQVVCTPSGGAQSVRIELPGDWEQKISEEQLLDMIRSRLDQAPGSIGKAASARSRRL
jgi:hypothetical protein